jgi:ubiquinone biosynthesis protein COQ4
MSATKEVSMLPSLSTVPRLAPARTAFHAVRALLADPNDLPKVFTVLEALPGDTLPRMERRLVASEPGRRLLAERPDVVRLLEDRDALRRLPEGSLGRAYLAFVESENISAAGIREADARGSARVAGLPDALAYLEQRMRDTHDLWHAVTGYKGDVLGETALLAFTLAQTWNPGIGILVAAGLYKTIGSPEARALIVGGFRRGRRAAWFPEQRWEAMLAEPVTGVRARLGVGAPPVYVPVRAPVIGANAALAA